ncbi:MAG: hypothetical protein H6907_18850 [Hyphomicrobiales bacterium]|nr:hypothetical protein [Hyphomicrobiales bacterium]MCP5373794.1 hypothetical protein [Hyphomicrobiales bacterium]
MRTVIYFQGGTVADFAIPDDRFDAVVANLPWERRYAEDDLKMAQGALDAFLRAGTGAAGPQEVAAAAFLWNFFNTNPDPDRVIEGDIIVVDLAGDGETIEYASTADVPLKPAD